MSTGHYPHKTHSQEYDDDNFDALLDKVNDKVNLSTNLGRINIEGQFTINDQPITPHTNVFDTLELTPQSTEPQFVEGQIYYDSKLKSFTFRNDIEDSSLQVGSELWQRLNNDTGSTLNNGMVVYIKSSVEIDGRIDLIVDLLDAKSIDKSTRAIGVITSDILNGEDGYVVRYGKVNDINTNAFEIGDIVYADPENIGYLTNIRPIAPHYHVRIGVVIKKGITDGVISVDIQPFSGTDTSNNIDGIINGIATQKQSINFVVESGNIYADVINGQEPTKKLPFILDGNLLYLDTLTGSGVGGSARCLLTPGTSLIPKLNYIYILLDNGNISVESSTELPSNENNIILGSVSCYDAATTLTNGDVVAYRRRNNSIHETANDGLINEMLLRIRKLGAIYESGVNPTINIGADDAIKLGDGVAWQFHKQQFSATNGEIFVINDPTGVKKYTSFNDINLTLAGTVLNNQIVGYEVVACMNSEGVADKCLIILPSGAYASNEEDLAIYDSYNYSITNIEQNTGMADISFRVCRVVVKKTASSWSNLLLTEKGEAFQDRRGFALSTSSGGGGGGSNIITSFNDDTFEVKNATDQTKIVDFDVSGVSTGTRQTLTVPDSSGTIALEENIDTDTVTNVSTLTGANVTEVFDNAEPMSEITSVSDTDNVFIGSGVNAVYITLNNFKNWVSTQFNTFFSNKSSNDLSHIDNDSNITNAGDEIRQQEILLSTLGTISSDTLANKIFTVNTAAQFVTACATTDYTNITIIVQAPITLSGTIDLKPKNILVISPQSLTLSNNLIFTGDTTNLDRILRFNNRVTFNGNNTINYNGTTSLNISFNYIDSSSQITLRNVTFNKSGTGILAVDYCDNNNISIATTNGALAYLLQNSKRPVISWNHTTDNLNVKGSVSGSCFEITVTFEMDNTAGNVIAYLFPILKSGIVSFQRVESLMLNDRAGGINNTAYQISNFYDADSMLIINSGFGSIRGEGYILENNIDDSGIYITSTIKKGECNESTFYLINGAADTSNGTEISVTLTGMLHDWSL